MILKKDVNEHYGEPRFCLKLRFFGEQVYGTPPADSLLVAAEYFEAVGDFGTRVGFLREF